MALPVSGSTHLIPAYYSIYRPRKDERLSWPSWLTYSGWLTHMSGHHQLQVERRTGKVRRPETDVLPLCHATNWYLGRMYNFVSQLLSLCERQTQPRSTDWTIYTAARKNVIK